MYYTYITPVTVLPPQLHLTKWYKTSVDEFRMAVTNSMCWSRFSLLCVL